MNQASALMVAPARINFETDLTITNNLDDEAYYTVESECAEIAESEFELEPYKRHKIHVIPECNGHVEVKEETKTAINKFNLPVKEDKERSWLWSFAALVAALTLIGFGYWKLSKKI